jgi:hypothetical protein
MINNNSDFDKLNLNDFRLQSRFRGFQPFQPDSRHPILELKIITRLKMTICGTLSSKTLIKGKNVVLGGTPDTSSRTPVGNDCSKVSFIHDSTQLYMHHIYTPPPSKLMLPLRICTVVKKTLISSLR